MTAENMPIPTTSCPRVRMVLEKENERNNPYYPANSNPVPYPRETKYCDHIYAQRAELHVRGLTSGVAGREDEKYEHIWRQTKETSWGSAFR